MNNTIDRNILRDIQKYAKIKNLDIIEPINKTINNIIDKNIAYNNLNTSNLNALNEEGILRISKLISDDNCANISEYLKDKLVSTRLHGDITKNDAIKLGLKFCNYNEDAVYNVDLFHAIANHPGIINLVSEYFGNLPTIQYMMCRWTLVQNKNQERSQFFHHDYHGVKFLKLFIYLTDVNEKSTAHVFVKGTHDDKICKNKIQEYIRKNPNDYVTIDKWNKKKQFGGEYELEDNVIDKLFKNEITTILGKKGDGFIEDTNGMHKGNIPKKDRLFFSVLYTLCDSYKDAKPKNKYLYVPDLINNNYPNVYSMEQINYMNRFLL